MNVFISDLRDVIAWSLHGGEELRKPTRMRWNIFSVWWKGGNQKCFLCCFPIKSIHCRKMYCYSLRYSFVQSVWRPWLYVAVTTLHAAPTQHPPHLQTSRPHPLRKTEQPPLFSFSQSTVPVRWNQQTDSKLILCRPSGPDMRQILHRIGFWDTKPGSLMSCEIADMSDFGWPIN